MNELIDAQRLRDMVSIRWYFFIGLGLVLLLSLTGLEINLSLPALLLSFGALLLANLFAIWRLHSRKHFCIYEVSFHLGLDVLLIFFVTYTHGGSHNPFALFFFMPMIQAALILPLRLTWIFSAVTCLFYLALFINDIHHHHGDHLEISVFWQAHLLGMIITFIILSFFMTNYMAKTSARLRAKEESEQEQEKLLLLGSLAAQAAHQLGTPLNSLVLLNRKIRSHISEEVSELFSQELKRCQTIIQQLADKTSFHKATEGGEVNLASHIELLAKQWQDRFSLPIVVENKFNKNLNLTLDHSFDYALFNLFDNAKEAGATVIKVVLQIKDKEVLLDIIDDGVGFQNHVQLKDKPEGMGLGLYLTKRTMMNMKGSLQNIVMDKGAHLQLRWPI